jgi:hypothetical protein
MPAISTWFKKVGSIGEPVPNAIKVEDLERQLVTALRKDICDRWWRSLHCRNDGTQSEVEFEWSVMREKRIWWRWNFGEEMPF